MRASLALLGGALFKSHTETGTPYAVGVHVDEAGRGFEFLGGLLRAGERIDCSRQALEAEGFELLTSAFFFIRGKF